MTELENKILEHLNVKETYRFSSDALEKSKEKDAIKNLENNGYIRVKSCTIGYVLAEIL